MTNNIWCGHKINYYNLKDLYTKKIGLLFLLAIIVAESLSLMMLTPSPFNTIFFIISYIFFWVQLIVIDNKRIYDSRY